MFDASAGVWSFLAPLPLAVTLPGSLVHDNTFYVMGGMMQGTVTRTRDVFKMSAGGTWETVADALPFDGPQRVWPFVFNL